MLASAGGCASFSRRDCKLQQEGVSASKAECDSAVARCCSFCGMGSKLLRCILVRKLLQPGMRASDVRCASL